MVELSLVMIVRDEAEQLVEFLPAVLPYVDEWVAVDTGSTDETVAILQSHGIEPHRMAWPESFEIARNEALSRATGEWILALDADERLDPGALSELRSLLEGAAQAVGGFILSIRNYTDDLATPGWVSLDPEEARDRGVRGYAPSTVVRLFRNLPEIRYRGRIHELVEPSIEAAGYRIQTCDVTIHHSLDARLDHPAGGKPQRYRRLLELKVGEDPTSAKAHWELGQFHASGGCHEEAVRVLEEAWRLAPGNREIAIALAPELREVGRCNEAIALLERARQDSAKADSALEFQLGLAYQASDRNGDALTAFYRSRLAGAKFPQVFYWIALLVGESDPEEALRSLSMLYTVCERFWPARLLEAELREGAGERVSAIDAVARAAREEGREPGFIWGLADLWARHPSSEFRQCLEERAQLESSLGFALVAGFERLGEAAHALEFCQRLKASSVCSSGTAELLSGRLAVRLGRLEEAQLDYQALVDRNQHAVTALYEWSQVEANRQRWTVAANLLDEVIAREPRHSQALVDLAGLHGNAGRLKEARQLLERAAEADPADALTHHNLAVLSVLSDPPDLDGGRRFVAKARELGHPPDPELEARLGVEVVDSSVVSLDHS